MRTFPNSWSVSYFTLSPDDVVTVFIENVADSNEAGAVTKYDGTDNEIQHIYTVMIDKHPILDSDELIGGRFMCPKTELPDFMNDNPFIPETKNLYNILMKHYFS